MKNIKTYENYNKVKTISDYIDNLSYPINLDNISFSCSANGIESLEGIEKFINLTDFFCYSNRITSLDGVENLTNLTLLSCNENKITSLKPIENLTKLENLYCQSNLIDWIDYIDKQGNKWYIKLPKSIKILFCDNFNSIKEYWEFMDKNQPAGISRKFNF